MNKNDKRAIFHRGKQSRFLKSAQRLLGISRQEISEKLKVHPRTYCDWYLENGSMPLGIVYKICTFANIEFPSNITIREPFWSVHKAAKIGGIRKYQKYGHVVDENHRRTRWFEWWENGGRFQLPQNQARKIYRPRHSSVLAEFVGIMLGDGGMTQYQICITLGSKSDQEYSTFLKSFLKKLFHLSPAIQDHGNSFITHKISRKALVDYCMSIGLCVGNKVRQQIDIPSWIKEDDEFIKACIRGLMDTDGCIFLECHRIQTKQGLRRYCYPRISLVSYSHPLRTSIYGALKELGFSPNLRSKRSVTLERRSDIIRYFDVIGTHNPKHQKRFIMFTRRSAPNW